MLLHQKCTQIIRHLLILVIFISSTSAIVSAQDEENVESLRTEVVQLLEKDKYIEALPLLEKLVIVAPEDSTASFYYGFALLAKAQITSDKEASKKLRIRARKALVRAKELGSDVEIIDGLIESLPLDGSLPAKFSENEEAEKMMVDGEAAFTSGDYDKALKLYGAALKLDPKIYSAALFSGDMYLRKGEFDNAEIWYQKAIKIDPTRETAYRYSATPLMRQKKYDLARERYIEAYIVEPYNRFASIGLTQWARATNTEVGHPQMDIPEFEVDKDGKAKSTITLSLPGNGEDDPAALSWIGYTSTRTEWLEKKFAKTFPTEKTYRHTLQEEVEALRSVIKIAKDLKGKNKRLNPQFKTLIELDEKGLLEAFILLAIPDQGIAQDHADYLKNNRAKLRQYVNEYVIGK